MQDAREAARLSRYPQRTTIDLNPGDALLAVAQRGVAVGNAPRWIIGRCGDNTYGELLFGRQPFRHLADIFPYPRELWCIIQRDDEQPPRIVFLHPATLPKPRTHSRGGHNRAV